MIWLSILQFCDQSYSKDVLFVVIRNPVQYTLSADRQNEKLEGFCNPHHEAILRLIEMTVKNGHKAGIWVGICGELGADLSLTREFIRMGVDELSVSPAMILKLRKNIVEMNAD